MSDAAPFLSPLAGHHALVTGGARGIGGAIVDELARLGASVTILDINAHVLADKAATLTARGARVATAVADITKPESVDRAFTAAEAAFGPPQILVNNAGVADPAPFLKTSVQTWQRILDINLNGAFHCTQRALPAMMKANYGRVIATASTAGLVGYRYSAAYCASKHGVVGLTRALALELAKTAITVNCVCPGFTDTAIVAEAVTNITSKTGRSAEEARASLASYNPQGRIIAPAEIAMVVGWLALPASGSITGQAIPVAGGEVMS